MHGKNICDSLSNIILAALRSAVANGEIVDAGTHALVLWLAEHRQLPSISKLKKEGWWAVDEIYYGYYDPVRFTKLAVPNAKGFNGSASKHRFVSTSVDAQTAQRQGPVQVSTAFCGCKPCSQFNFRHCAMRGLGGMPTSLKIEKLPSINPVAVASQTATLEDFARSLAKGQVRAVVVDRLDRNMEGDYWLCKIQGPASQATERQAHATVY